MVDLVNAFVTNEGEYGRSVTSPQLPGFVMGRKTEAELERDYEEALRFAGLREARVVGHSQLRGVTQLGNEFIVRRQSGDTEEARAPVADALLRLLHSRDHADEFVTGLEPSPTGEFVFVAALATDTIGWLSDQLFPSGDVLTAAVSVADAMVVTTQIATGTGLHWPSLAAQGWTLDTTLGEVITRNASGRPLALSV